MSKMRNPQGWESATNSAAAWMTMAFGAALAVATVVLVVFGPGERGTDVALQMTGRLSFLFFWPAYAGGPLATLFGAAFDPLKRHVRDFGLAFAAAHLVHIALVGWLIHIGAAPAAGVFVFFGIAVVFTYLLALFSIPRLQQPLGSKGWWLLRTVGLNYIAYAFASDFLRHSQFGGVKDVVGYLPFAILSIVGPTLWLAALLQRIARVWKALLGHTR